jgi:HD-GYP domain-containing protein (c-di-GMP phosphodiesterase class II)
MQDASARPSDAMQVLPLHVVRARVELGAPLPFSVRAADRTLLLAVGQRVHDEAQFDELFERGAVVEVQELKAVFGDDDPLFAPPRKAAPEAIPAAALAQRWVECAGRVAAALAPEAEQRLAALALASRNVALLVQRSAGVAMSQVVRQEAASEAHYGITHAMNAAIAAQVTARTLGWSDDEQQRALHAALTMNLAIIDLQGRLAHQVSPLTAKQRQVIDEHPLRSASMLEEAGVDDEAWLAAVREHHETPDGKGYPSGQPPGSELGQLLRFADIYTALMSRRATRAAMSTHDAAREIYALASGSALCQALIKSFGVFPPGCFVRLASGEVGVVTGNGELAHHPRVAVLTHPDGQARPAPLWRNTADKAHRIVALLSESAMPVRVGAQALAGAIDGDPG